MKALSTCLLMTLISWLPAAARSQPALEEPLPMEVHIPLDAQDRGPDFEAPPPGRPGQPGDPMNRGPRMGRGGPGDAEHLERWLDHMRRKNPEEFERLMVLREEDPKAFHRALRKRRDQLRDRDRTDPFHDMSETRELAKRYHETPEEGREAVRAELRAHLEQVFTQREEQQRRRILQMEEKMEDLRSMLDARAANREAIITRRLEELLGEDPLVW